MITLNGSDFLDALRRRSVGKTNLIDMWRQRRRRFSDLKRRLRGNGRITSAVDRTRKFSLFAKLMLSGVVGGIFLIIFGFTFFTLDLPSPDKIVRREGFSTKILDRNGEVLYDIYTDQNRTLAKFEDIPDSLKQATIAIEDKNFYNHQGFDVLGILRGFSRLFTRGYAQGGSTLTQQLVKNVLLSSERSIFRKIRELVLTIQIERKFSKDEILQMYLNEAPYGGTAWGVESASENYFGKTVKDLDLVESAILAGLPQRPSYYSPYSSSPKAYVERATQVLRRMREDGYISEDQEKDSVSKLDSYVFKSKEANFKAPHFVQYVERILEDSYGQQAVEQGGLRVTTTLNLKLQEKAQQIVAEEIAKVETFHITNGSAVVINPQTGEILAMVGSKDFNASDYDGQVNVATALRQPGSSIKPITYAAGLMKGYTASTLFMDVPTEFPGGVGQPPYTPGNYDGKFRGPIQLRYALANSVNIPAVKMLALAGLKNVLQTSYDLGITSLEPTSATLSRVGLSLTLGGGEVRLLEISNAYSAFVNEGYAVAPTAILKVVDNKGKVLEENKPEKKKQVLSPEVAYIISDILSDNKAREMVFGLNSLLNIPGRQIAVKTGTTNNKRDNWTIGGNPEAIVGVWVGNNDNSEMKNVASGITGASPIWRKILLAFLEGRSNITFKRPDSIVEAKVDSVSGYGAHDGFPERTEIFAKGTEPTTDPVHLKLKVCKNDGKLATPSDIASNNYDEREYFSFKEEDPFFEANKTNKWQEGINNWIATLNDGKYNPPTDYCGTNNPVNVEFNSPTDHTSNLPNKFTIKVSADSTSSITELVIYADSDKVRTFTNPPYSVETTLTTGVHTLKAVAKDQNGKESERVITIGVNVPWDYSPTPVPSPTPTPLPVVLPTI